MNRFFISRVLCVVMLFVFVTCGCNMMQTLQTSDNSKKEEELSNWSMQYISPSERAKVAYAEKYKKPGNTIPFDGIVVRSGKNEGGRVETGFIQNYEGENVEKIMKVGETTGRALLKGGSDLVGNLANGLPSAFVLRDGLKNQGDKVNQTTNQDTEVDTTAIVQ